MYRTSIEMHNRLMRGEAPLAYILIRTHMGYRAYAAKELKGVFTPTAYLADGSYTAGGAILAGAESVGVIDKAGRLLSLSGLDRTLQPQDADYLTGWFGKDLQSITVELDDADDYFSRLIATEPFITRDLFVYAGFEDLPFSTHLPLFKGTIVSVTPGSGVMALEAEEKISGVYDTWFLGRAGRYANPLDTNARLPLVYGDLTDGADGNWACPCIDTVNHVYCYAGFAVLTVADGNSVAVYVDGVLQAAGYTFSASNNYEGLGAIATITFTADQGNKVVTVRGKGLDAAGVLIDNAIDQIEDLLTVQNAFSSSLFESTSKARARQKFLAQGYKAAGVIAEDITYWELIIKIMSSFLGSAYLSGDGLLCFEIDDGTDGATPVFDGILSRGDIDVIPEALKFENIINRCPASYAYDYASGSEFKRHTDDSAHSNVISQSTFGEKTPDQPFRHYWCRDLAGVNKIQDIIVGKFGSPVYEATVRDNTLKRLNNDIGDIVLMTARRLFGSDGQPLYNQFWKVLGVSPDYLGGCIDFRVLQTPYFLTVAQMADGSHLADGSVKAGGDRDTANY